MRWPLVENAAMQTCIINILFLKIHQKDENSSSTLHNILTQI